MSTESLWNFYIPLLLLDEESFQPKFQSLALFLMIFIFQDFYQLSYIRSFYFNEKSEISQNVFFWNKWLMKICHNLNQDFRGCSKTVSRFFGPSQTPPPPSHTILTFGLTPLLSRMIIFGVTKFASFFTRFSGF